MTRNDEILKNINKTNTHSYMEKFTDGLVAPWSAVGHGQREHARPAEDGVLVQTQGLDEGVGLLQAAVHRQRDPQGQASQDLLVLGLLSILP